MRASVHSKGYHAVREAAASLLHLEPQALSQNTKHSKREFSTQRSSAFFLVTLGMRHPLNGFGIQDQAHEKRLCLNSNAGCCSLLEGPAKEFLSPGLGGVGEKFSATDLLGCSGAKKA